MKEIIIDIDENATVSVRVNGIKGAACKDATKALEKALGTVTSTRATSEMRERSDRHDNQSHRLFRHRPRRNHPGDRPAAQRRR